MTNEEAIRILENLKTTRYLDITIEALDKAIEALKNERPRGEWLTVEEPFGL